MADSWKIKRLYQGNHGPVVIVLLSGSPALFTAGVEYFESLSSCNDLEVVLCADARAADQVIMSTSGETRAWGLIVDERAGVRSIPLHICPTVRMTEPRMGFQQALERVTQAMHLPIIGEGAALAA